MAKTTYEPLQENEFLKELIGQTCLDIQVRANNERLIFYLEDGRRLCMEHDKECCEAVWLEEIIGDLADLIGTPILVAEERIHESTDDDAPPGLSKKDHDYTWSFYEFRTIEGSVTLRWYGTSNGCYSERVDLCWLR